MMQIVDQAFDDVFRGLVPGPLTLTGQQKTWQGPVMKFSLIARLGFIESDQWDGRVTKRMSPSTPTWVRWEI